MAEQYLDYLRRAGQAAGGWMDEPNDGGDWQEPNEPVYTVGAEQVAPDTTATTWDTDQSMGGVPAWAIGAGVLAVAGIAIYALMR